MGRNAGDEEEEVYGCCCCRCCEDDNDHLSVLPSCTVLRDDAIIGLFAGGVVVDEQIEENAAKRRSFFGKGKVPIVS